VLANLWYLQLQFNHSPHKVFFIHLHYQDTRISHLQQAIFGQCSGGLCGPPPSLNATLPHMARL